MGHDRSDVWSGLRRVTLVHRVLEGVGEWDAVVDMLPSPQRLHTHLVPEIWSRTDVDEVDVGMARHLPIVPKRHWNLVGPGCCFRGGTVRRATPTTSTPRFARQAGRWALMPQLALMTPTRNGALLIPARRSSHRAR